MPDKQWKPTKRQEDFLALPDSIFEAMYGGAAGGGKTETLLMLPLVRQFFNEPRFKLLFLRRTFPELDNEVVPRSKEFYNAAGFLPYQDQKKRWTHPSGAIVQFGHCEHEKDVAKYDTSEYNIICFDELTSFTEYQYMYLTMSRCRSSSANLPAFCRSGTNPGNIGHGFVRKRFVEPARDGYTILREKREFHGSTTELLRIFIPSKAEDNTYLMASDPGYLNRLNALPEAERAAKLLGDWWTFSGQVFDEWRVAPFPDEPKHAQHVCEPFRIPDYWPKILAIDWGYSALTVAGWYAINPCPDAKYRSKIYKYREYVTKKTKISTWAADIANLSSGETFADIALDPSAWGHRGDEFTIAEQFAQVSKLTPRKADNDRVGGKLLMQDLMRWKPRPARFVPATGYNAELELEILRKQGDKARKDYLALFMPEPLEMLPAFNVFGTCEETIKHIPLCVYSKEHPEDVAEMKNDTDDVYDETRYGLKACQFYLDGGIAQLKREAAVGQVCSDLERTGNQTQFYMKMERLDREAARSGVPVKRFHGNRRLKHANW